MAQARRGERRGSRQGNQEGSPEASLFAVAGWKGKRKETKRIERSGGNTRVPNAPGSCVGRVL